MARPKTKNSIDVELDKKYDVCDDCLLGPYDNGIDGYSAQALVAVEMGAEMPDHMCILTEEPDEGFVCDCSCLK